MSKTREPKRNMYVGHRYVPKIMGEWDKEETYEGLSIVTNKGASYTSKKRVPVGIDILDEEFWVVTGNYNAQVEEYRKEVREFDDRISDNSLDINANKLDIETNSEQLEQIAYQVNSNGTDDTENINQAIDYVYSLGGGTLLLPDNYYRYSSDIHVKEGVILEGQQETRLTCNATSNARIIFYNSVQMRNLSFVIPKDYDDSMFLFSNEFLLKLDRQHDPDNNVKVFIENIKAHTVYNPNTPNKKAVELYATLADDVGAQLSGYWGIKMEDMFLKGFNTMFDIKTDKTGWINGNLFRDVTVRGFEHAVKVTKSSASSGIDYNIFELLIQTEPMTKDIIVDDGQSTNNYDRCQIWDMATYKDARVGTGVVKNVMNGIAVPKEKYTDWLVSRSYYLLGRFSKFSSTTDYLMISLVGQGNNNTDYYIRGDDELVERRVHGADVNKARIKFFKKELPNGQVELYLYNDHDVETYSTVYIESFRNFYPSPFVRYDSVDGLVELTNVEDFYPSPKGMYTKGVNEHGSWVKYDDGTMICRMHRGSEAVPTLPHGVLYHSPSEEWIFPQEFASADNLIVTVDWAGLRWGGILGSPTTTSCKYYAMSGIEESSGANVYLMATGRWK